jgi:hypothetical protein
MIRTYDIKAKRHRFDPTDEEIKLYEWIRNNIEIRPSIRKNGHEMVRITDHKGIFYMNPMYMMNMPKEIISLVIKVARNQHPKFNGDDGELCSMILENKLSLDLCTTPYYEYETFEV